MIPAEDRAAFAAFISDEGSRVAEELIWGDDWAGSYRASHLRNGIRVVVTVTASDERP